MQAKLLVLSNNQTWVLVPRPPHTNIIQIKWIFRVKKHADSTLDRYKARLVANGFTQQSGLDYTETFSSVIKFQTIRMVIALVATFHWPIKQLDISNAFLHGRLDKPFYMEQPVGFRDSSYPDYVCKLRQSLYGLKQALRAWFERLSRFLFSLGFMSSQADHSLFIYAHNTNKLFVLVYVDDILVTGISYAVIHWFFDRI
jgi:hypothetical protein